jgi:hypothetical protein
MVKQQSHRWVPLQIAAAGILAALLGLWGRPALAQEVIPSAAGATQTVVTLTPDADASIDALNPNENYGDENELHVTLRDQGYQHTLLRFDLSAFPEGVTINSAMLRLYQVGSEGSTESVFLPIFQVYSPWDEGKVTWATQPSADNASVPPVESPGGAPAIVDTDITNLVDGWVNAPLNNANHGLMIVAYTDSIPYSRVFGSKESARPPELIINYSLPPIYICREETEICEGRAGGAIVSFVGGPADRNAGTLGDISAEGLPLGQPLWARLKVGSSNNGALYHTLPQTVLDGSHFVFNGETWEIRLAVSSEHPLWIQNLTTSAQWHVEANPSEAAALRSRIVKASNYLYSFTDGQFALGDVAVRQLYDGWDGANIQLFANNTLQPKAIIGGIVPTETADFAAPTVPITYTSGAVSMGSYWNRFGSPPNSVNIFQGVAYTEADMADDWPLALAHEFGHYLLYLFDTYTGVDGVADIALTELCIGTAMGDVYKPANQNFIFNPTQWNTTCNGTEAFAGLGGRTEWQTIAGWYPWAQIPTAVVAGPAAPPTPLTTVRFISPRITPAATAAGQFNLEYQDGESSSGEARAFLYQGGRLVEQGKPPKESLAVQVTGAQVGDRLCVYDINDHAEAGESTRHQFACEQIIAGDDTVVMTKDTAWDPQVNLRQVGTDQVQVIVTASVAANLQVRVQLYPEHQTALAPIVLPRVGAAFSATVTLTQPVPALYAQVFVNEAPPLPTTRREVVADRGTGGGGAFGPARAYGGVLVVSSDGNASFEPESDLDLNAGESIAWQSMPGTPPLPFFKWISGQSYRLDAFPPLLVTNGTVRIAFDDNFGLQAAGEAEAAGAGGPALHFWDGSSWRALPTQLTTPAGSIDGTRLASAPSQGTGVYAVLTDVPPGSLNFLPMLRVNMK